MALRDRVLDAAKVELAEAAAWYELERPELGAEFILAYEAILEHALKFPETGSLMTGLPLRQEFRRFLFKRFPYALVTMRLPDELVIVAVAHQHRKPGYWRKRLAKVTR